MNGTIAFFALLLSIWGLLHFVWIGMENLNPAERLYEGVAQRFIALSPLYFLLLIIYSISKDLVLQELEFSKLLYDVVNFIYIDLSSFTYIFLYGLVFTLLFSLILDFVLLMNDIYHHRLLEY